MSCAGADTVYVKDTTRVVVRDLLTADVRDVRSASRDIVQVSAQRQATPPVSSD